MNNERTTAEPKSRPLSFVVKLYIGWYLVCDRNSIPALILISFISSAQYEAAPVKGSFFVCLDDEGKFCYKETLVNALMQYSELGNLH